MLKWKNTSIYDLSKEQLREALSEAISISMLGNKFTNNNDVAHSFTTGIFVGAIISITGILIALTFATS